MNITGGSPSLLILKAILLTSPVLLLTVAGSISGSYILLLILSIYMLIRQGKARFREGMDRDTLLLVIAMAATFVSVGLQQLYQMQADASAFDSPSRFLVVPIIYMALRNADYKAIGILQYGLPLGALLIGGLILASGQHLYARTYFLMHIHLGDLALMLGVLSVLSINWTRKDSPWLVGLKVLGLLAGAYVSLLSGARGGWAAIPMFLVAWALTSPLFQKNLLPKLVLLVVACGLAGILSFYVSDTVHMRVEAAVSDLRAAHHTYNSSLGARIQLWQTAVEAFGENPLVGVGPQGYRDLIAKKEASGEMMVPVAITGMGEIHSYYFATLARYGLAGMAGLVLLFFVPLWLFYKRRKEADDYRRIAARMGMAVVLGFMVYCLTVEMFNLKMIATFYAMNVAVLLAAAYAREPVANRGDAGAA